VEAGDYYDPVLLNLEEYSVGKPADTRTATIAVNDLKLQRTFRYRLNRGIDCQRETLSERRAQIVVPRPCFQQILIRLWYPDNREYHGFLKRFALICSQGMTSEGFCSCRAMR
jgi:hypothetical protein